MEFSRHNLSHLGADGVNVNLIPEGMQEDPHNTLARTAQPVQPHLSRGFLGRAGVQQTFGVFPRLLTREPRRLATPPLPRGVR